MSDTAGQRWTDERIDSATDERAIHLGLRQVDAFINMHDARRIMHQMRDDMAQALAAAQAQLANLLVWANEANDALQHGVELVTLEQIGQLESQLLTDHWQTIEDALKKWGNELEFDEERMHIDTALAFVREQQAQPPAMTQYLKGHTTIVATRDEWNQRYVDGWNDGNSDAKDDGPQVCSVCDGDGEVEDYSHLSPPVDGDWPMITCPKCSGTGLEPQPAEKGVGDE